MFDSQLEAKRVDLQLKLLQQKLNVWEYVMEYISILKIIRQDITKAGFFQNTRQFDGYNFDITFAKVIKACFGNITNYR